MPADLPTHLLFVGERAVAAGDLPTVALACRDCQAEQGPVLVFEIETGRQIDLNVSGSRAEVERRYGTPQHGEPHVPPGRRSRGRPRLGVVGREVTLLPRHWEWLDHQRGGASAALRRLIDEARKANRGADRVRLAQDRTNRFLSVMAGDLPGFEEATRALYGGDGTRFAAETGRWPADIRHYAREMARDAFP